MSDKIDVTAPAPQPTAAEQEVTMGHVRHRPLSRSEAKKLHNLNAQVVRKVFSGDERKIEQLHDDLRKSRESMQQALRTVAQYKAILEACVRRYGTLAFDKTEVIATCSRGRVAVSYDPLRITVELMPELELVDTCDDSVDTCD